MRLSCVISTSEALQRKLSSFIKLAIISAFLSSNDEVGSSQKTHFGSPTNARATASLCFSPMLKFATFICDLFASPTLSKMLKNGIDYIVSIAPTAISKFCLTVNVLIKLKF